MGLQAKLESNDQFLRKVQIAINKPRPAIKRFLTQQFKEIMYAHQHRQVRNVSQHSRQSVVESEECAEHHHDHNNLESITRVYAQRGHHCDTYGENLDLLTPPVQQHSAIMPARQYPQMVQTSKSVSTRKKHNSRLRSPKPDFLMLPRHAN